MSKKVNITTTGLISVTDKIRAAIFVITDTIAPIQSIEEDAPHNDRNWTFFGLEESINYLFKIQKLVSSVWQDIPGFNFTFTSDTSEIQYRAPELLQVDATVGLVSGTNTVTFDGTSGKRNWKGWDILIERIGVGTMKVNVDYVYDSSIGQFTLLQDGDIFNSGEYYSVQFNVQNSNSGGGLINNGKVFSSNKLITSNYNILSTDFGKKLIVEGASDYLELTLPDINTIPENKLIWIETGIGSHINAGIVTYSGTQKIDWLLGNRTNLFLGRNESIVLYRQIKLDSSSVWRVHDSDGNFKIVGNDYHSYQDPEDAINSLLLDGGGTDGVSFIAFARLYEFVLSLNPAKVCSYADWSIGSNYLKFSYKDPITGLFRIPNTRNLFIRNTSLERDAGVFEPDALKEHNHASGKRIVGGNAAAHGDYAGGWPIPTIRLSKRNDDSSPTIGPSGYISADEWTQKTGDTETRPKSNSMNHFIYI